jgi:hypothetical protein
MLNLIAKSKKYKLVLIVFMLPIINILLIFFTDYLNFKYISLWLSNKFYENLLLDLIQTPITAAGIILYSCLLISNLEKKQIIYVNLINISVWFALWIATYIKSTYTVYLMYSIRYYLLWLSTFVILMIILKEKRRQ